MIAPDSTRNSAYGWKPAIVSTVHIVAPQALPRRGGRPELRDAGVLLPPALVLRHPVHAVRAHALPAAACAFFGPGPRRDRNKPLRHRARAMAAAHNRRIHPRRSLPRRSRLPDECQMLRQGNVRPCCGLVLGCIFSVHRSFAGNTVTYVYQIVYIGVSGILKFMLTGLHGLQPAVRTKHTGS